MSALELMVLDAERTVSEADRKRDSRERRSAVHRMTRLGMSTEEIADRLGISDRQVTRLRKGPTPVEPPRLPLSVGEQQELHMVALADLAADLACRLRDEDPALVWAILGNLPPQWLRELTVTALAMIPTDRSMNDLLDWLPEVPE